MSRTTDLSDQLEALAIPCDPKTRLTVGEHEESWVQHGNRVNRKSIKKRSRRTARVQRKVDLPPQLHTKLFSDTPGLSALYDSYKLNSCQKARYKELKKLERTASRRSRELSVQVA